MGWMGFYFLPDALESLAGRKAESERDEAENAARETESQHDTGRRAVWSGDIERVAALAPSEFEFAAATVLRMLGMSGIRRVAGRGHFGVDIVARDQSGHTILVQCARRATTKKIGSPEIRKFIGTSRMHHETDLRMYVTTSAFTEHARVLAQQHDIRLISGTDIELLAQQ